MKQRKLRLVLECVVLATELARLAIALLNMAFNYPRLHDPKMVVKV
jgi:hypothetical protein